MTAVVSIVVVLVGAVLLYLLFAFGVFGAGLARSRNADQDGRRAQPPGRTPRPRR
ncbi:MAG: hypothetical protein JWM64_1915 [Frankiales bacterium]|nr:hypothetical protein [Frankiales bacterium]